jgi:hypothetical protein
MHCPFFFKPGTGIDNDQSDGLGGQKTVLLGKEHRHLTGGAKPMPGEPALIPALPWGYGHSQ